MRWLVTALVSFAACAAPVIASTAIAATAIAATDPVPAESKLATPQYSAEPVFREFRLLGEWAIDCGQKAAPTNPHVSVTAPGGGLVVESHDVGPDYAPNLYHVTSARRIDARDIEVKALFRPGSEGEEAQTLVIRVGNSKGADTRRTMFNRTGDGVRVKNGIAVRSGAKTAVLRRCG